MNHSYFCEQCAHEATLCVSDWGYIAALCDDCLKERESYLKLPDLVDCAPAHGERSASAVSV